MRRFLQSCIMLLLLASLPAVMYAQNKLITGIVLNENNSPLPDVTVSVRNTTMATKTNANGRYSISAKPGDVLNFSFVGYISEDITVGETAMINVTLRMKNSELGEVVVTALGIKKERKALGYSVSELKADELMKNKNTNIINSLAGKVPGVNITQFSGAAGAGASITIRGGNSTSESRQNQPLFVIDGVIYDNSTIVTGNTGTDGMSRSNTTFSNRIMDVNPEDIESLSVLKGAAAAALYGSRAADGVIVITTKKGAEGTAKVDVTSRVSTSWANKLPEVQSEFGPGSYSVNGVLTKEGVYSSWGEKITSSDKLYNNIGNFFQNGIVYDNNVNVSGGSKNGSFYLSGSNFNQTGIVPNTSYDKTT
ncbi:MAG: TonB-dependent receptor plug domain-containing protein, partial [Bacteroidetes bacterium]|nr:TonB-dependent receptor plug domain-containing protein [Bacteroidota bacterium]